MTELLKVVVPLCDVKADAPVTQVVLSGCLQSTQTINTAQSYQLSPALPVSALWTLQPPSAQTLVDRNFYVKSYLQFDFTGGSPQLLTNDSLGQLPFSALVDNVSLTINGESTTENMDKIFALMTYGNDAEMRSKTLSLTAAQPDQYQQYSDWSVYGSARNVMGGFGENSTEPSRGAFVLTQVSPTQYRAEITEPLFLSPLVQFGEEQQGLTNCNQFSVNIRFRPNTSVAWSHSSLGNAITAVTTTFYQAPELLVTYITPQLLEKIPLVQTLPYSKCNEYIKSVPTLSSGASTTVISDSIRLSQIPKSLYLFCKRSRATQDYTTPNSFLGINSLSLNWNNQSALFSQCNKQQLYKIASDNGLNYSFPEFSKYRGSVLRLDFGKDIGLGDAESPGCQGSYTVSTQLGVTNLSNSNFQAEFYMVVVNTGAFSVAQNSARASLGLLTPAMVLSSKEQSGFDYNEYKRLSGGSFWSSLKDIVGKVSRGVSDVAGYAKMLPGPYGQVASAIGSVADPLASALGAGYVGGRPGGSSSGSSRLVGGRRR